MPALTIYTTSSPAVRKRYQNSLTLVRILKALKIDFEEEDLNSDESAYTPEEVKELCKGTAKPGDLPQIFCGSKHVGTWEEFDEWNEDGEVVEKIESFGYTPDEGDDE